MVERFPLTNSASPVHGSAQRPRGTAGPARTAQLLVRVDRGAGQRLDLRDLLPRLRCARLADELDGLDEQVEVELAVEVVRVDLGLLARLARRGVLRAPISACSRLQMGRGGTMGATYDRSAVERPADRREHADEGQARSWCACEHKLCHE